MDQNIIYTQDYKIKSTECGSNMSLKPSSLLSIIQDVATLGAEHIGAGTQKVTGNGYIWVVTKMEIEIERMPKYLEDVKLITYPNKMIHFIYPRTILIKDKEDNTLVKASTLWCILNYNTRKLVMPNEINLLTPGDEAIKKISPIDVKDTNLLEERKVRINDLDINMHMNNVKYLDYIVDTMDIDFVSYNDITNINLVFHEEVKFNETLSVNGSKDKEYFRIDNNNKKVFECNIKYKGRN